MQCDSFFFFIFSSFLIVLFQFLSSCCDPSEDASTEGKSERHFPMEIPFYSHKFTHPFN